ncbi:MAG: NAD-dependent epimerase/dehydratase family protein [Bacteroidota bacterium]
MQVLIAGGTGFIGRALRIYLEGINIDTKVLTRKASESYHVAWAPELKTCNISQLRDVTHIINLTGEGIADKRWTKQRKKVLISSRVETTIFLHSLAQKHCPKLIGYVGISGVNAFGFGDEKIHQENAPFGTDFLSQLVKDWEEAHKAFDFLPVFSILRLGMVLSPEGGAYTKIAKPMRWGFGAIPGKGSQWVPWVHLKDVVHIIHRGLTHSCGLTHLVADNSSMKELTEAIAQKEQRKIYLPNIPPFMIRLIFGEMGGLLTESVRISTENLLSFYTLKHPHLSTL